jgi:hypothetical protein
LTTTTLIKVLFMNKLGIELAQSSPRNKNPPGRPLVRASKSRVHGEVGGNAPPDPPPDAVVHVCLLGHKRTGSSAAKRLGVTCVL